MLPALACMTSLSHDTPPLLSYSLSWSGGQIAVPVCEQVFVELGIWTD